MSGGGIEYTTEELVAFLEARHEQLWYSYREVANNHTPKEEREEILQKIKRRQKEVRHLKGIIAQGKVDRVHESVEDTWVDDQPNE